MIGQSPYNLPFPQLPTDFTITVEGASNGIASQFIKVIPTLLWVTLIVGIIITFYKPIKNQLIPRASVTGISFFGIELAFLREQLDALAESGTNVGTSEDRKQVARRAARLAQLLKGAHVLIVNDNPRDMVNFEQILRSLGIEVEMTQTTDGALSNMRDRTYDVVISDRVRAGVPDEGQRFLEKTVERDMVRPTIFGVRQLDPCKGVPPHAFGITNRTAELLNLVFDAIERTRG